jgi:hypothetical protein
VHGKEKELDGEQKAGQKTLHYAAELWKERKEFQLEDN